MNPNSDPQPVSTVEPQKPLLEILDAYDRRAESAKIFGHVATENYRTDVPALVKALRKQQAFIEWSADHGVPTTQIRFLEEEITAILNQGRK